MGLSFDIDFGDGFSENKATYGRIANCKLIDEDGTVAVQLLCFSTKEDRENSNKCVTKAWLNIGNMKNILLPLFYPLIVEKYDKLSEATKYIDVEFIELSATAVELVIGENIQLTYSLSPNNANYTEVVWASSQESVATIQNGFIMIKLDTEISEGSSIITLSAEYGRCISYCKVTVKAKTEESVATQEDT